MFDATYCATKKWRTNCVNFRLFGTYSRQLDTPTLTNITMSIPQSRSISNTKEFHVRDECVKLFANTINWWNSETYRWIFAIIANGIPLFTGACCETDQPFTNVIHLYIPKHSRRFEKQKQELEQDQESDIKFLFISLKLRSIIRFLYFANFWILNSTVIHLSFRLCELIVIKNHSLEANPPKEIFSLPFMDHLFTYTRPTKKEDRGTRDRPNHT
jgi:hypothetical protein